jgi:hypothetical protein
MGYNYRKRPRALGQAIERMSDEESCYELYEYPCFGAQDDQA